MFFKLNPKVIPDYSVPPAIPSSCRKLDLLKHACPAQHTPLKKGRAWRSWSGACHPQPISSHVTVLPFPANTRGMHSQVKFLRLPTSLSPSSPVWVGTFCPPHVLSRPLPLFPLLAWRTLNDGRQSLSLWNTEGSLMRKTVLRIGWPWTLGLPLKEAPVS